MALFGRRKSSETPPPRRTPPQPAPMQETGTVIVSRSGHDNADGAYLVYEVVEFVNSQITQGLYKDDELPPKAQAAYYADYYLAQVNNGGHAQFIHNSQGSAQLVFDAAERGLREMGAREHAAILAQMLDWRRANPQVATLPDEGPRPEALNALDTAFYEIEQRTPMAGISAAWIRSWPELRVVEDERYREVLDEAAAMNPHRADRRIAVDIMATENRLTDETLLGIGLACMAGEGIEILLGQGNGSYVQFGGTRAIEWVVGTTSGRRTAIAGPEYWHLFERIEHSPPPDLDAIMKKDSKEVWKEIEAFRAPERGPEIGRVSHRDVARVKRLAEVTHAGAAIDLLLRMAGAETGTDAPFGILMPPEDVPAGAPKLMMILATEKPLRAMIYDAGAALMLFDGDVLLAKADREQIAAHSAKRSV